MQDIINKGFEGSELTIYLRNGEQINLDIDLPQLTVMLKAVGFEMPCWELYNMFGEDTCKKILNGKINPFHLVKPEDYKNENK